MGGGYRNQSKRLVRRPTWLARALRYLSQARVVVFCDHHILIAHDSSRDRGQP
jgi:hypothetical protein